MAVEIAAYDRRQVVLVLGNLGHDVNAILSMSSLANQNPPYELYYMYTDQRTTRGGQRLVRCAYVHLRYVDKLLITVTSVVLT